MANINVAFTENVITVDENLTNVTVTSSVSNITVSEGGIVTVETVRESLSAVSPILYNTSSGVFSFDSNASFAGKTTDDLNQGTNNRYWSTTGNAVSTTYLVEGTNLYYTNARVNAFIQDNITTTDIDEGTNLYFTNARVLPAILNGDVKLKQFSETAVDKGNLSGNITLDVATGSIFYGNITGDITGITLSNVADGTSVTLVLTQDGTGNHDLDLSTYIANWNNWYFANEKINLNLEAASKSYITVVYAGGVYNAAVLGYDPEIEQFVRVNTQTTPSVVTLAQGPKLGYYANTKLAFGNVYLPNASGDGSIRNLQIYDTNEGDWETQYQGAMSGISVTNSDDNYGAAYGKFNPYTSTETALNNPAVIALKDSNRLDVAQIVGDDLKIATSIGANITTPTIFYNDQVGVGQIAATERLGVVDSNTLGAARFIGNVIIQPSNKKANTTFKFGTTGSEIFQLDHGAANTITARAPMTSNSSITTTANVQANYFIGNGSLLTGVNAQVLAYIATQPLTVGGNLQVNGNINATGNINYQNVTDLYVTDQKITLNANAATNADVEVIANRPEATDTKLKWNESTDRWTFTNDGSTYYNLATSTTDVAEGTNLYYTTDRANSAMDDYLVSITANVDSVNGQTGAVSLDTGDIPENGNLYFTTARANSAMDAYLVSITANVDSVNGQTGVVVLDTGDVAENGNLYFTTDRANSAIGAYQGSISTPGNISAGNVITDNIYAANSNDLTINSENRLVLTQNFAGREVGYSGNVTHDGYAFFNANAYGGNLVTYTGSANLQTYVFEFGNTTAGSNAITDVSMLDYPGNPVNLADIEQTNLAFSLNENSPYPFPAGTYVTSIDAANSTIYMSQNATATQDLEIGSLAWFLHSALIDTTTGQVIGLYTQYDATGSGSKTNLVASEPLFRGIYGYPQSGFAVADFDVITAGSPSDYSLGNSSSFMVGRNRLAAPKTVLQAPQGMIVGNNADLTNRAENDQLPSFGVNVLWDGTDDSYLNTPLTQILVKQYTDNSLQGVGSNERTQFGPRIFFTASEGNASQTYAETYPRANLELGRVAWWGASQSSPALGTSTPSGWISGVTGQDHLVRNSGMGMYFGIKPNINNNTASIWLASTKSRTLLAGGRNGDTAANISFAPLETSINNGNSVQMYDTAISSKMFANIGYANMSTSRGSKITVTNGGQSGATFVGDTVLGIDRKNNTTNVTLAVSKWSTGATTNLIGRTSGLATNAIVMVYTTTSGSPLVDGDAVTITGAGGDPANSNVNGNVFYVDYRGNTGNDHWYVLYTNSGLTSVKTYDVAWTGTVISPPGLQIDTTWGGSYTYSVSGGVTDRRWDFSLEEQSEDLKIKTNGSTVATITTGGNISATTFIGNVSGTTATLSGNANITGNINLGTNASINYDEVYGCFHKTANVTAAAADTPYEFDWSTDTTVHAANRISISSNSHIDFAKTGTYELCIQFQIRNDDNALRTAYIWLRKNGTDVEQSTTRLGVRPKGSAAASYQLNLLEWLVEANAGDYYEVVFAVDDTSGIQLEYQAAQVSPYARPAIPSAVLTVKPVGA